jgi:hypothetical protein
LCDDYGFQVVLNKPGGVSPFSFKDESLPAIEDFDVASLNDSIDFESVLKVHV